MVAGKAGKLAPVIQLLIAIVLYCFRYIYEQAVTAIPLNGGSYNILLNTTSKRTAVIAATFGIITYLATGVASGTTAISYLNTQVSIDDDDGGDIPVVFGTICLFFVVAILPCIGIKESGKIALIIFIFHVLTLSILAFYSMIYAFQHPEILTQNILHTKFPDIDVIATGTDDTTDTGGSIILHGTFFTALFFGYSTAMLGTRTTSSFETCAQFIEQQKTGVFQKTLRNLWLFSIFCDFCFSFLTLAVLPLEGPEGIYANQKIVLAKMAVEVTSGNWLKALVCVDAFSVLVGSVLASYIGIIGLGRRLAFDRILPFFLTIENPFRQTNHCIIFLFFFIQSSLVFLVFTVKNNEFGTGISRFFTGFSSLSVMFFFAFGCLLLKVKRNHQPVSWEKCLFGILMVFCGLLGNFIEKTDSFTYFVVFFCFFGCLMFFMLERVFILRIIYFCLQKICPSSYGYYDEEDRETKRGKSIVRVLEEIHLPSIVFFCKRPELETMNKAILYVRKNEQTHHLQFIHVFNAQNEDEEQTNHTIIDDFINMTALFDAMYPKLKIDFIAIHVPNNGRGNCGKFDKACVQWIAQHLQIPPNMMFLRQPSNQPIHQVISLGVRVITG
jgi:amino acid transporter